MKLDALSFLRCPACKSELSIIIFEVGEENESDLIRKKLTFEEIRKKTNYEEIEVKTGILLCENCKRWYPIGSSIEKVPELLYPDELREKWRDKRFIRKWINAIPEEIVEKYKLKGYLSD